jgi:hypothetical protein
MQENLLNIKANKFIAMFLVLFVLSSCSSLSSMKFWGSDEADSDEPKTLEPISNSVNININWTKPFSGDNFLGNFIPAF